MLYVGSVLNESTKINVCSNSKIKIIIPIKYFNKFSTNLGLRKIFNKYELPILSTILIHPIKHNYTIKSSSKRLVS